MSARVSPNGQSVAFMSSRTVARWDLWITSADGAGVPRQMTEAAMAIDDPRFAPEWSPDGSKIAYVSNASDYWEDDVWVLDLPSGQSRRVSNVRSWRRAVRAGHRMERESP